MDYAEGRPVTDAPPSLRVYALAKRLPGVMNGLDVLDLPALLWAEFVVYAAEESRVESERSQRRDRGTRERGGSRLPSRRRGRN